MFETAELDRKISSKDYKEQVPALREALLNAQQELRRADFPVIVLFAGVDGAGKGETVNKLNEWMDPRWLITHAYSTPSQEEQERPEFWRFWRDLPREGRLSMFLSAWYSQPVLDRVNNKSSVAEYDERLDRIISFEKALADDGALLVKFWMHLGRSAQKKRLKTLEKDPLQHWRVTETDWHHWRLYDDFVAAAERAIMRTSTGDAPWHIIEGFDERYRYLTAGNILLRSIAKHLDRQAQRRSLALQSDRPAAEIAETGVTEPTTSGETASGADVTPAPVRTILSTLDMTQLLAKPEYRNEVTKYQGRLNLLHREALARNVSTLLVFEGWDAAGKGGAIRRCTAALDARHYQVIPFAKPTDEERGRHYLWRFWRHLSRAGRLTFYDRSWYGRVLVERVEGFASEKEWMRAYAEINDFEAQLVEYGVVLLKFWIHITPEEQLARFKAREQTPYKRWKLTDEDWRNRDKWAEYELAVNDMIERTSTGLAPWTLVEGNDKRFARVKVLKAVCDALDKSLSPGRDGQAAKSNE